MAWGDVGNVKVLMLVYMASTLVISVMTTTVAPAPERELCSVHGTCETCAATGSCVWCSTPQEACLVENVTNTGCIHQFEECPQNVGNWLAVLTIVLVVIICGIGVGAVIYVYKKREKLKHVPLVTEDIVDEDDYPNAAYESGSLAQVTAYGTQSSGFIDLASHETFLKTPTPSAVSHNFPT